MMWWWWRACAQDVSGDDGGRVFLLRAGSAVHATLSTNTHHQDTDHTRRYDTCRTSAVR